MHEYARNRAPNSNREFRQGSWFLHDQIQNLSARALGEGTENKVGVHYR